MHASRRTNAKLIRASAASLVAVFVGTLALLAAGPAPAPAGAADARPNVIVVMTDDQAISQFKRRYMPNTLRLLGARGVGTRFSRAFVSSPLCCPSRAGFLAGAYPHNDGVFDNEPGYPALVDKDQTIFTWLDQAGYRTGHIGRFLLNYDKFTSSAGAIPAPPNPPGVDDWFGYATSQTYYYDAPFSDNGAPRITANTREGYITRVLNEQAQQFIRESAPSSQPFFLWLAHLAPHSTNYQPRRSCGSGAALNEPDTYGPYRDEPLPRPASFNEKKNRDKPTWIESRPPLGKRAIEALTKGWRCALASLTSVDRGVANIVRELRHQGELDNTAILFTSDNGYLFGEHRVVLEKIYPYEEAWRVPLLARVPAALRGGGEPPRYVKRNVSNVDLTATVLDLADAQPCAGGSCRSIDGRSILPLLGAPGRSWPKDRAVLAQIGNRRCGVVPAPGSGIKNHYDAIRTRRYMYAELNRVNPETGACDRPEFELYDLKRDPNQMRNQAVNPAARAPSALQTRLANRLHALVACAGAAGRDAPLADGEGGTRPLCE